MRNRFTLKRIKRAFLPVLMLLFTVVLATGCASQQSQAEKIPVSIDYDKAVVSYLGPEGTYTEAACGSFFGHKGEYVPYETVNDAVTALSDGKSNYAVIPQENTIGGAVTDYIDTLIDHPEVSVVGEVELPIDQNLLTLKDAELSGIKTVYSHKQGIAQGKEWLAENLPDAEVIEVSSTAEGAKMVAERGDKSCAAIASAGAAEVYGLEILAPNIQNNDKNKTRFYALSVGEAGTADAKRLAFIVKGSAEELPELMDKMEDEGVTLVTIHDRPQKTELGEYYYLIECEDMTYDDYTKLTEKSDFEFRYLGSFDVTE